MLDLAIACLTLAKQLEVTPSGKHIARQLIRCSSSAGANDEEARSAESVADFIHKIGIAAKEMRETAWWLRLVDRGPLAAKGGSGRWADEASQLLAILISSARTASSRAGQRASAQPAITTD